MCSSLSYYKDVLGFRVFDGVAGSISATGKDGPKSAVVGFSEAGAKASRWAAARRSSR